MGCVDSGDDTLARFWFVGQCLFHTLCMVCAYKGLDMQVSNPLRASQSICLYLTVVYRQCI